MEPRDDLEKSLVEAWEEVLDRSPIGIRDNFFDLGGHSLLATRLLWKIEKAIGVNLPLEGDLSLCHGGEDGRFDPK